MNLWSRFVILSLPLIVCGAAAADDNDLDGEEKKPETIKVSGIFETRDAASPIAADTKQVTSLKLKMIKPHGTEVKKGQAIIQFETEGIDKKIEDAERSLRLAELALEDLEVELKQLQQTTAMDVQKANRMQRRAKEDYDYYVAVSRQQRIEQTQQSLRSAEFSLEYASEELQQLEQMYREDELTEESEEIVLKRAQRAVESAELRLNHLRPETERTLSKIIPREADDKLAEYERAQLDHDKKIKAINVRRRRREAEIRDEQRAVQKQVTDLQELREDRKRMVLTSPIDGVVYHGELAQGAVAAKPSTLKEGSSATNTQVLVTVLDPKSLQVRIDLPEKDLATVRVGSTGTITPTGRPDLKLGGTVKEVATYPFVAGKFDCMMTVKLGKEPIVPGMTCEIEFEKAEN